MLNYPSAIEYTFSFFVECFLNTGANAVYCSYFGMKDNIVTHKANYTNVVGAGTQSLPFMNHSYPAPNHRFTITERCRVIGYVPSTGWIDEIKDVGWGFTCRCGTSPCMICIPADE